MLSSLEVCISSPENRCGSTIRLYVLYSNLISQEKEKKIGRSFDWSVGGMYGSIELSSKFSKDAQINQWLQVNALVLVHLSSSSQDLHCEK